MRPSHAIAAPFRRQRCVYILQPFRLSIRHVGHQKRPFLDLPTALVPPAVFVGLGIGLWTWKCCMMILFQNKIIYMPGLPPNARSETISEYMSQCAGIEWREERIRSLDGTRISLCLAGVETGTVGSQKSSRIYILYFQGLFPSSFVWLW